MSVGPLDDSIHTLRQYCETRTCGLPLLISTVCGAGTGGWGGGGGGVGGGAMLKYFANLIECRNGTGTQTLRHCHLPPPPPLNTPQRYVQNEAQISHDHCPR